MINCTICGKPCANGTGLSAHMRAQHTEQVKSPFHADTQSVASTKTIKCQFCGKSYGHRNSLRSHMVTKHPAAYRRMRGKAETRVGGQPLASQTFSSAEMRETFTAAKFTISIAGQSFEAAEMNGRLLVISPTHVTSYATLGDVIAALSLKTLTEDPAEQIIVQHEAEAFLGR